MTRRRWRSFVLVAAIGLAASIVLDLCSHQAMAASITLNTGVGGATYTYGYVANTTITSDAAVPAAALVAPAGLAPTFSVGPGLASSNISNAQAAAYLWALPAAGNWIGPSTNGTAAGPGAAPALNNPAFFVDSFNGSNSAPQGFYYYTTTFTATTPASITGGLWASDNQGVQAIVNGAFVTPAVTNSQYLSFAPLSIPSSDFVIGLNTVTFLVWNENYVPQHGSPNGIDIQATVITANLVPEPTAIAVVVSGLPLIGLFWAARRRRVSV